MKICPIFYAVLLHRRGSVDGGQLNMYGKCLGEKCQWASKCDIPYYSDQEASARPADVFTSHEVTQEKDKDKSAKT